jgi:transposase
MRNQYRFTKPPRAMRRSNIKHDNFFIAPASLLSDMDKWQAFFHRQPRGTAVMIISSPTSPLRPVYHAIAHVLAQCYGSCHQPQSDAGVDRS